MNNGVCIGEGKYDWVEFEVLLCMKVFLMFINILVLKLKNWVYYKFLF